MLAAGYNDGKVRLWDASVDTVPSGGSRGGDTAESAELDAGAALLSLAFSSDGQALAAGSGGGILVWNMRQPARPPRGVSADADVRSVAWNADGRFLAAGFGGGAVDLWDLGDPGSEPVRLPGHTARVEDLEFHPRRNLLASASFDGTLRLWNVELPEALPLVLEGHELWVWQAAFSPDGERLVSASSDRTVHVWTTSSAVLAAEICGHVGRDLTEREWTEFLPADVAYEKTCPELPASAGQGTEIGDPYL